jgi:hypothetical protein
MTGEEAILTLKAKLDKNDTASLPEIPVEIAVLWLNDAFARIIKQRYGGNNPKRESFEETQKRTDDLREVIKYEIVADPIAGFFNNSVEFALPEDYWFAIVEQAEVSLTDCKGATETDRVGITAIQHNNINTAVETDPFWKPEGTDLLRTMQGKSTTVYHAPATSVSKYYLGYISNDFKIDLSALTDQLKIADHLHSEIVDLAYNMILNAVESQRYQQDLVELSKSE